MNARVLSCVAVLAVAAGAEASCGDDDEPVDPTNAQPDVYVPEPRPAEELQCVRPGTGDAGDAKPTRKDPRTLVLRLDDLPRGFNFSVGYQEGGVGLVPLTEGSDELKAALEEAHATFAVAVGTFGKGRLAVPREPGAPPPPPSCPIPETEVSAAVAVASSSEGAAAVYGVRHLLASSTVGFGEGPVEARMRRSPAPVSVGDDAELLQRKLDRMGRESHALVWRDGPVIAIVQVKGGAKPSDIALLNRLATRQAAYVREAR